MANPPKISDAEWLVMRVLWERAPRSANEIIDALTDKEWSPATIRTLIGRLLKKGALCFEKSGREYMYESLLDEDACVRHARRSFIHRVYDGAVHPMLVNLLEDEELSAEELQALHRLLDEKGKRL